MIEVFLSIPQVNFISSLHMDGMGGWRNECYCVTN